MRSTILAAKRARSLRQALTEPEAMLWSRLRRRIATEAVFRRQHPLGRYILDFYAPAAKLCIEIDGHGHGDPDQAAHDQRRDSWLSSQGVTVHRITASSVFEDVDDVDDGLRRLAADLVGGHR
jgi:very-short-patch-repair endonuclease